MRPFSRSIRRLVAVSTAATVIVLGAMPVARAQDDVVYTTAFADTAQTSQEWGFKDGATTESGDGYKLELAPGALVVTLDDLPNFWISPELDALASEVPDDQVVEATIESLAGDDTATAGVVCRGNLDDDVGYVFLIGTDGYYTIGDVAGKATALVNKKGTKRTDAVDPDGPNTVRGECVSTGARGVRLTLFVNDEKIASVVDRTASEIAPEAWLATEVTRGRPAEVVFSSFTVAAA